MIEYSPGFLSSLRAAGFAGLYYNLCHRFPLRLELPACKAPAKEVLKVTSPVAAIRKCKGPGRAFEFVGQFPANGRLSFVIQGHGTSVEVFWERTFQGSEIGDSFAVLARALVSMNGEAVSPDPLYPRPDFHTLEELQAILAEVYRLGALIFSA